MSRHPSTTHPTTEGPWVKWTLIAVAMGFLTFFLFIPLAVVFVEALKKGWGVYLAAVCRAGWANGCATTT